jgi:hypothetical protein
MYSFVVDALVDDSQRALDGATTVRTYALDAEHRYVAVRILNILHMLLCSDG